MRRRLTRQLMGAVARVDLPGPVRLKPAEIYGAVTLGGLIVVLITILWIL